MSIKPGTDPSKGLLATYIHFSCNSNTNENFFNSCIQNLENLLGNDTPEIQALKILQSQHNNSPLPDLLIDKPPMFVAGMLAAAKASSKKQLVQPDSVAEKALDTLFKDMVYTSYSPMPVSVAKQGKESAEPKNTPAFNFLKNSFLKVTDRFFPSTFAAINSKPEILDSWIADSLLYLADKTDLNDINTIAEKLQITPNSVKKTIKSLIDNQQKIDKYQKSTGEVNAETSMSMESIDKLKVF